MPPRGEGIRAGQEQRGAAAEPPSGQASCFPFRRIGSGARRPTKKPGAREAQIIRAVSVVLSFHPIGQQSFQYAQSRIPPESRSAKPAKMDSSETASEKHR